MTSLPKPKFCDQNWLEMSPTEKGRLCAACQKNIVDFSKMRWAEIVHLQEENGNSLCGMYSEKQLEYWGLEVPAPRVSRIARAAVFLLGLVGFQARAQSNLPADTLVQKLVIKGTVTERSSEGEVYTLTAASIRCDADGRFLAGQRSDIDGAYDFVIIRPIGDTSTLTITFSYLGYEDVKVQIKPNNSGFIRYDVQMNIRRTEPTEFFYIMRPTRMQIIKWKFKSIFSKNYRDIDYSRFRKNQKK
jgi:hypothetical protein